MKVFFTFQEDRNKRQLSTSIPCLHIKCHATFGETEKNTGSTCSSIKLSLRRQKVIKFVVVKNIPDSDQWDIVADGGRSGNYVGRWKLASKRYGRRTRLGEKSFHFHITTPYGSRCENCNLIMYREVSKSSHCVIFIHSAELLESPLKRCVGGQRRHK